MFKLYLSVVLHRYDVHVIRNCLFLCISNVPIINLLDCDVSSTVSHYSIDNNRTDTEAKSNVEFELER